MSQLTTGHTLWGTHDIGFAVEDDRLVQELPALLQLLHEGRAALLGELHGSCGQFLAAGGAVGQQVGSRAQQAGQSVVHVLRFLDQDHQLGENGFGFREVPHHVGFNETRVSHLEREEKMTGISDAQAVGQTIEQ